ncbi:Uncharacterized protein OS=Pirellula staleyi (strain ATCC 27377 / DSM 6068 / ICPB 4128) GN=Psta_0497 PE=4 SV=1 [Gemmata massiliana]|uniref:Secreted protein n=1 Tax=Gemmata massiliana TaxID=1210884 RepID=A0A6P2CXR3_9BACT|nr:hypothetical protein [Gemmata massiliana]VTR91990.1 Uncharacterized protein OS=Pirellula staleyi (strain ATCC 27377 / DSM 6068 / ICPB 4128) GN=Psta_0497 PE=4 SV=1 [Gemmata massiliana]
MNAVRWFVVGCAAVLGGTAAAQDQKQAATKLPDTVLTALEKAEAIEVYSLNGSTNDEDETGWHATRLLGKTSVKGEAAKGLVTALKKGLKDEAEKADCFTPRHGIRVSHDGKTYDMLICFECRWMYVYTGEKEKPLVVVISDSPQERINQILTDAKVQIAK